MRMVKMVEDLRSQQQTSIKKKRARIEIQPIFNPISYEKPITQTRAKNVSLHQCKKIGPDRHRGRFNPIFYENRLGVFQILCQKLTIHF